MFYNFLKQQYVMGKLTKDQLYAYVPTFITEEQYKEIVGEETEEAENPEKVV